MTRQKILSKGETFHFGVFSSKDSVSGILSPTDILIKMDLVMQKTATTAKRSGWEVTVPVVMN